MKNNHIGTNIKAARTKAQLSQVELANKCGWEGDGQQARISHYENKRRSPSLIDLDAIAKALGMPLADLISYTGTSEGRTRVPLIQWDTLGNQTLDNPDPEAEEWISCPAKHSNNTYALIVSGDSMSSQSPGSRTYIDGSIIFVDRDVTPKNGDGVIAYSAANSQATFKTWVSDFGQTWLKPLNSGHPSIDITSSDIEIWGTVIGSFTPERNHTELN